MVECEIPHLFPENEEALEYWRILSTFDRPPGFSGLTSLSSKSIRDFCFDYDLTWDDYEKILACERAFVKRHREIESQKQENKKTRG